MNDEQILELWRDGTKRFASDCQDLSSGAIRRTLEWLATAERRSHAVFILEAMRVSQLKDRQAWKATLKAWLELDSSQRGDFRDLVARFASGPLLPAIQAAVISGPEVPFRFLAVLAHDGSDASLDALVTRLADERVDLDMLRRLRVHAASTPEMDALLDGIEHKRSSAVAENPALRFAQSIGIDVARFRAHVQLFEDFDDHGSGPHVPLATIRFDSTTVHWFSVSAIEDRVDVVPSRLPEWIADYGREQGVRWERGAAHIGSLKGKDRERFEQWLFSACV